jgi:hypothetical protein
MLTTLDSETAILHELSWLGAGTLDALAAHLPAYSRVELAEAVVRLHRAGRLTSKRKRLLQYHEEPGAPLALAS